MAFEVTVVLCTTLVLLVQQASSQGAPGVVNHSLIVREASESYFTNVLSWPAPEFNGLPITAYIIEWCLFMADACFGRVNAIELPDGASTGMNRYTETAGVVRAIVAFPNVGRATLRIQIFARNADGLSTALPDSFVFETILPEDTIPVHAIVQISTPTAAVIVWSAPQLALRSSSVTLSNDQVILNHFQVTISPAGGKTNVFFVNASDNSLNVLNGRFAVSTGVCCSIEHAVSITAVYQNPSFTGDSVRFTFLPPTVVQALNPPEALNTVNTLPIRPTTRRIQWPQPPTTGLTGYVIHLMSQPRSLSLRKRQEPETLTFLTNASNTEADITNQPFSSVSVTVVANYMPVGSFITASIPVVQNAMFLSDEDQPSPPLNVRASLLGLNRFRITWDPPTHPNGIIRNHRVLLMAMHFPTSLLTLSAENNYNTRELRVHTNYSIQVRALNGHPTEGSWSTPIIAMTSFGVTAPIVEDFGTNFGIVTLIITLSQTLGGIRYYQVVVSTSPIGDSTSLNTIQTSENYYVAFQADFTAGSVRYPLGDGSSVSHQNKLFHNSPLRSGTDYYLFVRAFSSIDEDVSSDSAVLKVTNSSPTDAMATASPSTTFSGTVTIGSSDLFSAVTMIIIIIIFA